MNTTTLHLAKQNFKFSSAHFLIFDEINAERLHGHNYQVKVDLRCSDEGDKGYAIDFHQLKKVIKDQCDLWDERVLLPEKHPDMKHIISQDGKNYNVNFRDRFYSFPILETTWLPVTNTSVENLSLLMAKALFKKLKDLGVKKLKVSVEETRGQSASSTVSL